MAKFVSPSIFAQFMALLEEYKIVQPITGREWTFGEALDMHFPPFPDWFVNALAAVILVYAIIQLNIFG